jgi:thiosulfate/3-mercaptopyruvate sulfurtransferase
LFTICCEPQIGFGRTNVNITTKLKHMKKIALLAVLAFILGTSFAQDKPILVDPVWLKDHLNDPDLVLLQVNSLDMDYAKEHIAGARFLWTGWLAPNTPQGSFNAPDTKAATEILQQLGISNDSHVVLCHASNEVTPTARMFLTLENLGLRGQVSFLNGGLEAWKKAGYPTTKDIPLVKKSKFVAKPAGLLVDKDYVLKTLKGSSGVVVDARVKDVYDGAPTGYPRDGHIAGAVNIPFTDMVDANNMFKPGDQLLTYFNPVVPDKGKELVAYCFIGQTASAVYLAGRILGYEMKLYDGSMQEWSRNEALPMEKSK